MDCDLVIAGAGPVGLATALYAASHGMSAIVLDRRTSPHDKACGEGIMPRGRVALREMGVDFSVEETASFHGIRFVDGNTVAEAAFLSGPGIGIRRTTLWSALANRARAAGTEIALGESVEDWCVSGTGVGVTTSRRRLRGRLLVAADGLHSSIRRAAKLEVRRGRHRRFGVRRHFAISPWTSHVEVYWSDSCEAYVTPVGPDGVGVAFLWAGDGSGFDDLLDRFPDLRARLDGARPLDRARGSGPFDRRARSRVAPGVALVGDAAGYVDPLTGEGLTLGFESARLLVDIVARGAPLPSYDRAFRRASRTHVILTRALLSVATRPALRRRVMRSLASNPRVFETFVAVNAGETTWPRVGLAEALRVLGDALP